MYITELLIPILKQDPHTKTAFLSTALPILTGLLKAATGRIIGFHGFIIEENDVKVGEQLKPFIGIEWDKEQSFHNFVTSQAHKLGPTFASLVAAKPIPEIYETSSSPASVFNSPFTEVFQVKIQDDEKAEVARDNWMRLLAAVNKSDGEVKSFSGMSTDLDERKFVGAIGWGSLDVRERVNEKDAFTARTQFLGLELAFSFLAKFETSWGLWRNLRVDRGAGLWS